jgi:tetratricopeptide (TPR) repeat protein
LSKRGRELAEQFFSRIPRLQPRFRAEAMAGMAVLAFLVVGAGWLLLPRLARYYNNEGHDALRVGNLAAAQRAFQRAASLNPDLVVPYQNLADVYQRIGRPQEAQSWYQKAIEHNLNFGPAYRGLGHLYNLADDFEQAEQVLLAGLGCEYVAGDADLETITRYQLLSDLGWAYLGQEQLELAEKALDAAVVLEVEVKAIEERTGYRYRLALPHYTLAQIYEQSDRPQEALEQWDESLRFLRPENWADQKWITTALNHIEQLEENQP